MATTMTHIGLREGDDSMKEPGIRAEEECWGFAVAAGDMRCIYV
jgi:hypothetical protein